MRIPRDIVNCVCFICVKAKDKYGLLYDHFIGTAYFIRRTRFGSDIECLVTAKHVLNDAKEKGYSEFYVRLNTFDGSSETLPIPSQWVEHENPAVDVAVLLFTPPSGKFLHFSLPLSAPEFPVHRHMFGSLDIGVGDDLFVTGLFSQRWGIAETFP
jgi:hypothetical protein